MTDLTGSAAEQTTTEQTTAEQTTAEQTTAEQTTTEQTAAGIGSGSADPLGGAVPPPGCPAHGGAVRLADLEFQQKPSELYRGLRREHGSIAPVLLHNDIPAWLVLGYPEVCYVTSHDELFARDSRRWNQWEHIPPDWPLLPFVGYQPSVLFTEGAEHRRRAGAITEALETVDQFELGHDCRLIAERLIDGFSGSGRAELTTAYAHAVPMRAAVQLCGMPAGAAETEELVRDLRISLEAAEGDDPVAACVRVGERIQQLVIRKHRRPGPDVTSRMLLHSAGLTDEEVVQDLISVIAAAQQPTANWICNTLRLLLTDDRFALNVSGGRVSVGQALNEVLWLDTPQNFIARWALRDTQLGGRLIRAGDCIVLGLAAANTDPQIWPEGHVGAENSAHLSFSNGEHRCPYPAPLLADVIARTAVETLLERLPDVVLDVAPEELTWRPSIWMRGLTALPVRFTPAAQ